MHHHLSSSPLLPFTSLPFRVRLKSRPSFTVDSRSNTSSVPFVRSFFLTAVLRQVPPWLVLMLRLVEALLSTRSDSVCLFFAAFLDFEGEAASITS